MKSETLSLSENALGNLGLASRAHKIVTGDKLIEAIRNKTVTLVILTEDASERTKKQLQRKCNYYKVDLVESFTISELSKAIGHLNRVAVGITDDNFRKMLLK